MNQAQDFDYAIGAVVKIDFLFKLISNLLLS